MVFFTCNACGQAIKKAQVEKHYQQRCRSCDVLSCMDCGKDFYGDDYKLHTQCISEDQKYGGKGYQAPQNANKGEAKQEQWLLRVREAVGAGNISSNIKDLLEQIAEYPNVPRKKGKFENFVRNSLKVHHPKTIEQVWNVFSAATAKPDTSKSTQPVPKETSEAQGTDSSNSVPDGSDQEKEMQEKAEEMKGKDKRSSKHSETSKSGQKNVMKNAKGGLKRGKDKRASKHSEIREGSLAIASESGEAKTIKKTKKKKSKSSEAENPANERVGAGVKVKAKKKKISKDRNYSKPAENEESDQANSSKEKVGVKQSKKDKKKKKETKSDKSLRYSDGEVSFELKLPVKKKISKKGDQPKSVAMATNGVVNTSNGLEEGAAKKSKKKKKKKEKIKSSKNKGLPTPSEVKRKAKSVEKKQAATGDLKQNETKDDKGFDSTGNKKRKKLKRKGDKDIDTVIVNKKVKLDVIGETKKAGTSKDKKKKKQNLGGGEKLKSSVSSIEIFPLAHGHLLNTDKKTAKKKKLGKQLSSFKVKDSRSSKRRNKPDDKHTTTVKREKKKEKKVPSKHMSPCKIDTSTSSDESGKDLKVKTKKKAGKHKKDIESNNRETTVKKAHSEKKKKKKTSSGVTSSDNAGEISTLSGPKKKRKADVSQNSASNHSNNSDKPASKDSVNGRTKKKKVSPPDKKLKGDKKKLKGPLGVVFPCSPGSNITSFELIGNQLVVHVKKVWTHGQTNIQHRDQKVLQDSSAEPLPQKVTKTSSHLDSTPKRVIKNQSSSDGDLGQWGETDIGGKEVKKKKRKHEETKVQPGYQNGTSSTEKPEETATEPSPKKAKKTSKERRKKTSTAPSTERTEETATEKVEETSIESSKEEVKKKKKKQEISEDRDQESSDVKKKKKRKHKETKSQLADISGNSLAETSPKRARKYSIESSPEKAKKKEKKKHSGGDGDQVASSEINGSEKAGKKTKSKQKEDALSNKTKVTNGLTSLASFPSGDSAKSKKKKKSKESTLISDSSKPDALSIDGSKKKKKKTNKEKHDSGSEKGSPVKTGTKSKMQGDDMKSLESENGPGTMTVKSKSKKGTKKSKDPNNNPVSFSTISPIKKSIKTKSKSEKSSEKKKKSHKKDKSKESSDMSSIAELKADVKKVKKSKKVKVK